MPKDTPPKQYSDFGTPEFQRKKQVRIGYASEHRKGARVKHASMLEFYYNSGHIDDTQYAGGYELAKVWRISGKDARVTWNYNNTPGGKGDTEEKVHLVTEAYQEYRQAMSIISYATRDVVIDVCCLDEPARARRMPLLRQGLDELAEFFRV